MRDAKTIAPGVKRYDTNWGYILCGEKPDLLSAGLAKPSWFASTKQRDKAGRVVRSKRLMVKGQKIRTTTPARGPCEVWIESTEAEKARQHEIALGRRIAKELTTTQKAVHGLEGIKLRLGGCSGLFTRASIEVTNKINKSPDELDGSSKLARAIDDLEAVRSSVGVIIKDLRSMTGA